MEEEYNTVFEHLGKSGQLSKIKFEFNCNVTVEADFEQKEIRKQYNGITVEEFCMEGITPFWFMGYLSGIGSSIKNREKVCEPN